MIGGMAQVTEEIHSTWRRTMGIIKSAVILGGGYVLGARAGRDRYEQLRQKAEQLLQRPEVQQVKQNLKDKASGSTGDGAPDTSSAETSSSRWRRTRRQKDLAAPQDYGLESPSAGSQPDTEATTGTETTIPPRQY
jgi:hypothetical protein